jgi:mannose-6-phosphate isomerase-like protein (cupin superfamily)
LLVSLSQEKGFFLAKQSGRMIISNKIMRNTMDKLNKCPWGTFEVLADAPDHKVKRIVVAPQGKLSLQRHKLRAEHWFGVSGAGKATIDGQDYRLGAGCAVDIPLGATHRLENLSASDLVIIEVQTGEYFGEDDIERLEDKYGRV